jgi:peptide/nickel transport system substrate-binding protein
MMKRFFLFALIALMVIAPAFAGGGAEQPKDTPPAEKVAEEAPKTEVADVREPVAPGLTIPVHEGWEIGKKGGRFVMAQLGAGPKTFNFALAEETSSTDVTERLFTPLTRRNQMTLEWEGAAAESWTFSDDQKTITVKIRRGMKWSDGAPVTAKDWVDTVNKILYDPDIQTSTRDSLTVNGVPTVWELVDDYTLKVTFDTVYAGILNVLNVYSLPMHVVGPLYDEGGADAINTLWGVDSDPTEIPSSGAWVIKEHVPAQRTVFAANPNYWEKDANGTQLPYLNEMVYIYTPDQDTQLQQFISGQTDYLVTRGQDYSTLIDSKDQVGFSIYEVGPSTATNFITFNQNPIEGEGELGISEPELTWLSNKTFRTALAHLIDRESLINNIEFGFGYPQYSFVPRFSPYYWDGVDDFAPHYDPITATELLDEIGYTDRDGDGWREDTNGNTISLDFITNSGNRTREAIGAAFAQEAADVGVKINFRPIDFNVLVSQLTETYDWNLILIGLTGDIDPISGANVYPSYGNLHMIEPNQESPRRDWEKAADAAWIEANNTVSEEQRISGYEKLQRIWAEELPWAYTFNLLVIEAYSDKLGNVKPHPTEDYDWEGLTARLYLK